MDQVHRYGDCGVKSKLRKFSPDRCGGSDEEYVYACSDFRLAKTKRTAETTVPCSDSSQDTETAPSRPAKKQKTEPPPPVVYDPVPAVPDDDTEDRIQCSIEQLMVQKHRHRFGKQMAAKTFNKSQLAKVFGPSKLTGGDDGDGSTRVKILLAFDTAPFATIKVDPQMKLNDLFEKLSSVWLLGQFYKQCGETSGGSRDKHDEYNSSPDKVEWKLGLVETWTVPPGLKEGNPYLRVSDLEPSPDDTGFPHFFLHLNSPQV